MKTKTITVRAKPVADNENIGWGWWIKNIIPNMKFIPDYMRGDMNDKILSDETLQKATTEIVLSLHNIGQAIAQKNAYDHQETISRVLEKLDDAVLMLVESHIAQAQLIADQVTEIEALKAGNVNGELLEALKFVLSAHNWLHELYYGTASKDSEVNKYAEQAIKSAEGE